MGEQNKNKPVIRIVDDTLTEKLYDDIMKLISQGTFTLAEVIGVLELVKTDVMNNSLCDGEDEDEDASWEDND